MMPSAKTESLSSAPPLNRLTRSYRLPDAPEVDWRQSCTFWKLTNGAGMNEPSRKIAMIASVKRIFLRRSGVRKIRRTALNTTPPGEVMVAGSPDGTPDGGLGTAALVDRRSVGYAVFT